jgi:hypothetical protein
MQGVGSLVSQQGVSSLIDQTVRQTFDFTDALPPISATLFDSVQVSGCKINQSMQRSFAD